MPDDPLEALGRALTAVAASAPDGLRELWLEQIRAEGWRTVYPVDEDG